MEQVLSSNNSMILKGKTDFFGFEKPKYFKPLMIIIAIEIFFALFALYSLKTTRQVSPTVLYGIFSFFLLAQIYLFKYPKAVLLNHFFLFTNEFWAYIFGLELGLKLNLLFFPLILASFLFRFSKVSLPSLLFLLFVGLVYINTSLSVYYAFDPTDGDSSSIKAFLILGIFVFICFNSLRNIADGLALLMIFWISILFSVVDFYFAVLYGPESIHKIIETDDFKFNIANFKISGITIQNNQLAAYGVILLPVVLYFIKTVATKLIKWLLILSVIIYVVTLIPLASRGGILLFVLFLVIKALSLLRKLSVGRFFFITLIPVMAFFLLKDMNLIIVKRFAEIGQSAADEERVNKITQSTNIIKKFPVLGVGLTCFPQYSKKHYHDSLNTHNSYLSYLTETGILGFLLVFSLMIRPFYNFYKNKGDYIRHHKELNTTLLISLILMFIGYAFDHYHGDIRPYVLIAVAINLTDIQSRHGINN